MSLLGVQFIHTVTLERYAGDSAYEPTYKDPVEIDCYFEMSRKLVKTADGDEIISPAKMYLDPSLDPPPPDSKVTRNGVEYKVIQPDPKDDLLTAKRHHTEVRLK